MNLSFRDRSFRILLLLSVVLVVLLTSSGILFFHFERVRDQHKWVAHTAEVIAELDRVYADLVTMETGQRGFLLTRDDRFLEPYERGSIEGPRHTQRLAILMSDNPKQLEELKVLDEAVVRRRDYMAEVLAAGRLGKFSPERQQVALREGRSLMESVRKQIEKMQNTERQLLNSRVENADRSRYLFYFALIATALVSIVAVSFAFRQFWKNHQRLEREANERIVAARIRESVTSIAKSVAGDLTTEDLTLAVQTFLSERVGALSSRFFAFKRGRLEMIRAWGVEDQPSDMAGGVRPRSLVDEAISRSGLWIIENVPEDYWKIGSGLGSARPRALAFLPLTFQGRKLGVVEMAMFRPFSPEILEVLEGSVEIVSVGLNAALTRNELQELLERTQQQAEELEAQQEELRSSNEELEQQARALESQQQALGHQNRELEATRMDLELKAQELQRSSQYKSDFLAKMSHELRTPLNGLLILSTLLVENKEKNLSDQQKQFAKSIQSAGNDLLLLINDILDLSKIEARKLNLKPEKFGFGNMIEQMRIAFEPQAQAKNLELITSLDESAKGLQIYTDRLRLEQVLRNFLSNAIKFTQEGFVRVEAKTIKAGEWIEISVVDSGIGIHSDKRDVIFEAFEQADGSVSRRFGGTGLGLTIARELADLLGGEVRLESEEGKGSKFTLTIPVSFQQKSPATHVETDSQDSSSMLAADRERLAMEPSSISPALGREAEQALRGLKKGRSILIVEDDETFITSVIEAAKLYDFQPIAARSGDLALAILQKHTPDAILLDIKLPGISGMGLLEMIKHLPHLRHIPVHMISAMDYQHNALRMGALGYLTKPVTMDKIRAALMRIENMLSNPVRRILLIEDDEAQILGISNLIAGKDVEVTSVQTGRQAIAKLKEMAFDCIVLDLSLPDMTGTDLLDELNNLEISLPPVVIYTGKELSREEESHLLKYSESIIIKGARSPERLLDEVNLFLHRVESLMPAEKREMLTQLRSQNQSFEGKTVLLVDDDMRNVFALTSALEAKNLNVRIAKDGIEALEALDKFPDIDAVLMDIMMPRMDGFEAMERIRKSTNSRVRALPVIALTAKAMREDHEKCVAAGASDYIPKPVQLDQLTTVLKVWLSGGGVFA